MADTRREQAEEIGRTNAIVGLDMAWAAINSAEYDTRTDYDTPQTAIAAYLVNAVDTAREQKVSAEIAVEAYLGILKEKEEQCCLGW